MQNFTDNIDSQIRRAAGIHYTSIDNIHRVIDPLFLNDLKAEFSNCDSIKKLELFHEKISELVFFDPACGSGNFLVEIFSSLYNIETEIISKLNTERKLSIQNFYGIELNDFSCAVARVSLMLVSNSKAVPNIFHGNALKIDWKKLLPNDKKIYIVGNPPFIGYSLQTAEQKIDVQNIFRGWNSSGKMDYAACWFKKAADFIQNTRNEAAFVATSSICQGEAVGILWKNFFDAGIKINFARRSFKWNNDDKNLAQVHCVIVGFANFDRAEKFIFDKDQKIHAKNINGYLIDLPSICIETRLEPISNVPRMIKGSQPTDDGNLIVDENFPAPKKYLRPLIGADEFLKNKNRWCLWLINAPEDILNLPAVKNRIDAVKNFRLSSKKKSTRDSAKTSWLFQEIRQPSENYIAVPRVSTKIRKYLPIGFVNSNTIATDALLIIPSGSLWLFGILSSSVHMFWLKTICGRLGDGFRYSVNIVYNNFPFPSYDSKIESTARKILDIRKKYSDSLLKLYKQMPQDLKSAHEENDFAVLKSFGFEHLSESEVVSSLLENYLRLLEGDF